MVRRCVQKATGLEFASKIINTKKLSARGKRKGNASYLTWVATSGRECQAGRQAGRRGFGELLAG